MGHSSGVESNFYLLRADLGDMVQEKPTQPVHMSVTSYYVITESLLEASQVFPASNALFGMMDATLQSKSLVWGWTLDGCGPLSPAGDQYVEKVVIFERGACSFVKKVHAAQEAGAAGVIIVNNDVSELFMMGGDGTDNQRAVRIPALMVSKESGGELRSNAGRSGLAVSFGSIDFAARKMAEGESTEAELGPRVLETLREPLITGNIHDFQFLGGNDFGPLAHAKF